MAFNFEILILLAILACLIVLIIKAFEIRNNLESLMVQISTGFDKIIK